MLTTVQGLYENGIVKVIEPVPNYPKCQVLVTFLPVLNMVLKEYLRKNNLKKILKYRGNDIWEGNLDEMRKAR